MAQRSQTVGGSQNLCNHHPSHAIANAPIAGSTTVPPDRSSYASAKRTSFECEGFQYTGIEDDLANLSIRSRAVGKSWVAKSDAASATTFLPAASYDKRAWT